MIPSSKIETRDLSPQVLSGVAQEETLQEAVIQATAANNQASNIYTHAYNADSHANNAMINTATNNTASATGTLSQKLSYIINQNNSGSSGPINATHGNKTFTSSGSWTCPAGVYEVVVLLASGGGGGGYATSGSKGSGGSAGNICCVKVNVTPGTVYNVAVGAGGAAGKNASNSGTGSATQPQNGGDSSFGNVVCIGGGCGANSNGNPTANSEQAIGARIGFNGCVLFIIAGNTGSRGNSGDGVGGTASVTSKYYYGFTGAAGGAGLSYGYGSNGESGKVAIIW